MFKKEKLALWLVLFVIFIDWLGIGLVYPLFSSMIYHPDNPIIDPSIPQSVRGFYLGILLAAMPIAQFFSGPIIGTISDQKGRRPLFLITLIVGTFGYVFCTVGVVLQSIWLLVVSRFLVGIAAGNAAVVSATIADLSDSHSKAKNFGLFSAACGVGFTIGPFLGGKFSEISFAIPFILAGSAVLLNLILIYFFFKETNHTLKPHAKIRIGEGLKNLKHAFHKPGLRALFATILFFCFGWSFFYEFLPVAWIHDYQISPAQIGLFYAFGAGIYAISSGLLIRPFVTRYKTYNILFYALCLLTIVLFVIHYPLPIFWVWIYLPIVNFLIALLFPTSSTLVSDWASKEAQGEVLGISQSIQSAAFAISPLVAGPLLGLSPHMPMLTGSIAMMIGAIILGFSLKDKIFAK